MFGLYIVVSCFFLLIVAHILLDKPRCMQIINTTHHASIPLSCDEEQGRNLTGSRFDLMRLALGQRRARLSKPDECLQNCKL
jgi:hypothetical protein